MIYTHNVKKALNLLFEKQNNKKDVFGYPISIHAYSVAEKMDSENKAILALLYGISKNITVEELQNLGFSNEVLEAFPYLIYNKNTRVDDYIKNLTENDLAVDVILSFLRYSINFIDSNDTNKEMQEKNNKNKDYLNYLTQYKIHQKRDIYKDSLYGFVVGDALGVPVECMTRVELTNNPLNDMIGYKTHMMPEGTWSDDTSMTLAELDSITEKGGIDFSDIMDKFVNWCKNNDYTATGVLFDIGNTTKKALINYSLGNKPLDCGCKTPNDNGNGSLMRMLPFIIYSIEKRLSENEEVQLINDASSLTHAHEISKLGCKIYCDIIKGFFNGMNLEEVFEYIMSKKYSNYYSNESINAFKRILDGSIRYVDEKEIQSHGYIISTIEASLWSLYNSSDYKSAVLRAINLGGDTDTIGAITGSFAGALYGMVPNKWIEKVTNIELVDYLYNSFIESLEKNNISKEK